MVSNRPEIADGDERGRPLALEREHDRIASYYGRELEWLAGDIRRLFGQSADPQYRAQLGSVFSEQGYPVEDPHVKRMVDSFALLTARIHQRMDDDLKELSGGLLEMLAPEALTPFPAVCMVQFEPPEDLRTGLVIPRGTRLSLSPAAGAPAARCEFRTTAPVEIWPIVLEEAQVGLVSDLLGRDRDALLAQVASPALIKAALRLRLRCRTGSFSTLNGCSSLRLHLGSSGQYDWYQLLFGRTGCAAVFARGAHGTVRLTLEPAGLDPAEALSLDCGQDSGDAQLGSAGSAFPGHRLLREYFAFPEKFLSAQLHGLEAARKLADSELELLFLLMQDPERKRLDRETFLLGCTPAVNLFAQEARPAEDDRTRSEILLVPEAPDPDGYRVHAIDGVRCQQTWRGSDGKSMMRRVTATPFYSPVLEGAVRWHARREQERVYLSLVDRSLHPTEFISETIDVTLTCTNSDAWIKELGATPRCEILLPSAPRSLRVRCRQQPTLSTSAPGTGAEYWRLLSLLTLGHDSLLREDGAALRTLLQLFAPDADPQVPSVRALRTSPLLRAMNGAFRRGIEVRVQIDEQRWPARRSPALFGTVLGRSLGYAMSMNTFLELVLVGQDGREVMRCAPQSGGISFL